MPADRFELQHLAVPAVVGLITFLSYGSQLLLLPFLEPGDLTSSQKWKFNILVGCIWVSYYRAVRTDPGRIPKDFDGRPEPFQDQDDSHAAEEKSRMTEEPSRKQRWCRKCECVKPARAHHCKVCKRCVPKMDHHCPWTVNCVSHFTLPHFIRFLFYATVTMIYLEYFFLLRALAIWEQRALPSYLGPSRTSLLLLMVFLIANSLTLFGVGIMFLRSAYDIAVNTTTIESWEISRHNQLLRRARALGGFLYGPDGQKVPIRRQEFPYDIGIWANLCQAMNSANPIAWLWVFSSGRKQGGREGVVWETNGFEDESLGWPPVDPDRMQRSRPWGTDNGNAFTHESTYGYGQLSPQEELTAFKQRQEADLRRREQDNSEHARSGGHVRRRKRFHKRYNDETHEPLSTVDGGSYDGNNDESEDESGEEGWRDDDGSRLKDMGVDEDVEFYDEDDMPLAELMKRRKEQLVRQ